MKIATIMILISSALLKCKNAIVDYYEKKVRTKN